jgi:putative ABC transport system permease protein
LLLLTWAMIRARRTQALTVFALAAVAVGVAVASGVYVNAAQQRILADDVAAATPNQLAVTVFDPFRRIADPDSLVEQAQLVTSRQRGFEQKAPSIARASGLSSVYFARYATFVADRPWQTDENINGWLEFREGFCDHVTLVEGRCVSGPGEVLVTPARAAAGFGVSTALVSTPVRRYYPPSGPPVVLAIGEASDLVVVGVYEPRHAADPYWGLPGRDALSPEADGLLTDRQTLLGTRNEEETRTVLAYPAPGSFTVDRLGAIRSDADAVVQATLEYRSAPDITLFLDQIERDLRAVSLVAGVATVPLVALCWYVLYLVIAYTARARRTELGMAKLRGVSRRDQWWMVAAESLVPLFGGALVGYPLGNLAVWVYARLAFGDEVRVTMTAGPLPYAAVALAGAVVAGMLAQRRDLVSTASQLLREVPALRRGWRGLAFAVLLCALAGLSLVQLRSTPMAALTTGQAGLGRFAPALLIFGFGLVCAALVDPVVAWAGHRAMRRGRLGLALAGLGLGRRRGGSPLLSLVLVAVALVTFAATASGFAAAERFRQTGLVVGADQVLTVVAKTPRVLLNAVRSVDPEGNFAMAAVPIFTGGASRALLAVDAPRLPKVAFWPDAPGELSAQAAAAMLHPRRPEPIVIHGDGLAVYAKLTATGPTRFPIGLRATVVAVSTGEELQYELAEPSAPGGPYTTHLACGTGCRLVDLRVFSPLPPDSRLDSRSANPEITVESIRQTTPDRELASGAQLARWRSHILGAVQTEPTDVGLRATVSMLPSQPVPILPPDAPTEMTLLDAGGTNVFALRLTDGQEVVGKVVATPARLPRLGLSGAFADLDYLLRMGEPPTAGGTAQVWLNASAPSDIALRLAAAGVRVVSVERFTDQRAVADRRPAAIGLRFLFIVGLAGLVLGAAGLVVAAGVERRARAAELWVLRVQGVSAAAVLRATLLGYALIAAVATLLGLAGGLAVWHATGAYLPILDSAAGPAPLLPGWSAVLVAVTGGIVMTAVAAILAVRLARTAAVGPRRRTGP